MSKWMDKGNTCPVYYIEQMNLLFKCGKQIDCITDTGKFSFQSLAVEHLRETAMPTLVGRISWHTVREDLQTHPYKENQAWSNWSKPSKGTVSSYTE